jgi:MoaD family protein
MAKVKVKMYIVLNRKLAKGDFEFDVETVADALESLAAQYGQPFRDEVYDSKIVKNNYVLLLNGEPLEREGLDKIKMTDGDVMLLFPPVSGG